MASATGNNSGKWSGQQKPTAYDRVSESSENPFETGYKKENGAHKSAQESALSFLIQGEVIPRLMVAHSADGPVVTNDNRDAKAAIEPAEAARFAPLPLAADADELLQQVEAFLDRGVSPESIFIDLLAPSARRLGQLWESDACDFLDVTMGLWRLQEVMREVARLSPGASRGRQNPPSALFSPAPGETHSFGALMVEEVFARAGWRSEVLLEPRRRELLQIISSNSYDLIGLTVSCDCHSQNLAELITAIKSVSKSPTTKVIIGGRMVNAHPDLVEQCGADGTATDAISALSLAERIVIEAQGRVSPTA